MYLNALHCKLLYCTTVLSLTNVQTCPADVPCTALYCKYILHILYCTMYGVQSCAALQIATQFNRYMVLSLTNAQMCHTDVQMCPKDVHCSVQYILHILYCTIYGVFPDKCGGGANAVGGNNRHGRINSITQHANCFQTESQNLNTRVAVFKQIIILS